MSYNSLGMFEKEVILFNNKTVSANGEVLSLVLDVVPAINVKFTYFVNNLPAGTTVNVKRVRYGSGQSAGAINADIVDYTTALESPAFVKPVQSSASSFVEQTEMSNTGAQLKSFIFYNEDGAKKSTSSLYQFVLEVAGYSSSFVLNGLVCFEANKHPAL